MDRRTFSQFAGSLFVLPTLNLPSSMSESFALESVKYTTILFPFPITEVFITLIELKYLNGSKKYYKGNNKELSSITLTKNKEKDAVVIAKKDDGTFTLQHTSTYSVKGKNQQFVATFKGLKAIGVNEYDALCYKGGNLTTN